VAEKSACSYKSGTHTDNKHFAHDAAAHMAIDHERKTTEHSPFLGWASLAQGRRGRVWLDVQSNGIVRDPIPLVAAAGPGTR